MKAVAELIRGAAVGVAIGAAVLITLYFIAWLVWG
jgi:hypothetical protein